MGYDSLADKRVHSDGRRRTNARRALRICVVSAWLFAIAGVGLSIPLEDTLPNPLLEWLDAEVEAEVGTQELFASGGLAAVLIALVVASVGLLFLQRWAAWLYLLSEIVGSLIVPLLGPVVVHGVPDALYDVSTLCSGAILGLAFFSEALTPDRARAEPIAAEIID